MHRRKYLTVAGVGITTALDGCGESEEGDREEGSTNDSNEGGSADSGSDGTDDGGSDGTDDGGSATTDDGDSSNADSSSNPVELLEHEWYNEGRFDVGVRGQLENISGETLSYVSVDVFFLNENDVQVASGLDNTTELAAGRVWQFEAALLGADADEVSSYEIQWDVNDY